jgi:adenylate cyclase
LGKKDEALTWLEKAFTDRDGSMMLLKVDPVFDQLRSDPRFVSLLKRMGLSE